MDEVHHASSSHLNSQWQNRKLFRLENFRHNIQDQLGIIYNLYIIGEFYEILRNLTLAVVDSIKEICLQWIGRDCWRMRLKDNMNPTIFMY